MSHIAAVVTILAMMDEQIASFNAVTGNENAETAKFFLESSQGNVEAAINMFLESGGAVPGAEAQAAEAAEGDNDDDMPEPDDAESGPKMTVNNNQDPNSEEQRCADIGRSRMPACRASGSNLVQHDAGPHPAFEDTMASNQECKLAVPVTVLVECVMPSVNCVPADGTQEARRADLAKRSSRLVKAKT